MVKRREKSKREILHLGIEIFEKRYQSRDFSGQLLAEFSSNLAKQSRYIVFQENENILLVLLQFKCIIYLNSIIHKFSIIY